MRWAILEWIHEEHQRIERRNHDESSIRLSESIRYLHNKHTIRRSWTSERNFRSIQYETLFLNLICTWSTISYIFWSSAPISCRCVWEVMKDVMWALIGSSTWHLSHYFQIFKNGNKTRNTYSLTTYICITVSMNTLIDSDNIRRNKFKLTSTSIS